MLQAIQFGIAAALRNGIFADVDAKYRPGAVMRGVKAKGAGIGKCFEHIGIFYNVLYGATVVLLIEKVAGFLPVGDVHMKLQAIFVDDDVGIERRR